MATAAVVESTEGDVVSGDHGMTFAVVGVGVDQLLKASSNVWMVGDEFAGGCAAIAFHMLTGATARLVACEGPGTNVAASALAIAAQEQVPVSVFTGGSPPPPMQGPRLLPGGSGQPAVTLVRFRDWDRLADIRGGQVITEGSAIPGSWLFGDRWLGYWGYLADEPVMSLVRSHEVVTGDGDAVRLPAPPAHRPEPSPLWVDAAVTELDTALEAESPIVADAGTAHEAAVRLIGRAGMRPLVQTMQLTTMGWSLGAALGAHVARPDSIVGVIIGDGSLLSRLGDVAALVRHRVPAVIVVLVNGLLGETRRPWLNGPHAHLARVATVDWAAAVSALGATVSPDIAHAVSNAWQGPQVVLVEGPQ